jgi:beta-1,4-mannosyltransferase
MIKSIHYPCIPQSSNPYNDLLVKALNDQGLPSQACNSILELAMAVLGRRASTIHFHWLCRAGGLLNLKPRKFVWQSSILLILVYSRLTRINTVWTVHDIVGHNSNRRQLLFYRLVASLVNSIIVHSPTAVDIISESYEIPRSKVSFIPHGNYPLAFDVDSQNSIGHESDQRNLRLVYFGHISPYKGLDVLALALQISYRQLGAKSPSVSIIGNLNTIKYSSLSSQLSLCNNLEIVSDFLDDDDLNQYLREADLIVLPFRYTFTSGSLIYALSAGKPVLTSRIDSLSYYLSPSFSFVCEPNSASSLADQIINICNHYSTIQLRAMGELARRFAMSLSWSSIAMKTSCLYK